MDRLCNFRVFLLFWLVRSVFGPSSEMIPPHAFAELTLDEQWQVERSLELRSRRVDRGFAVAGEYGESFQRLEIAGAAEDLPDARVETLALALPDVKDLDEEVRSVLARFVRLRPPAGMTLRVNVSRRLLLAGGVERRIRSGAIRLETEGPDGAVALVTTPSSLAEDLPRLLESREGSGGSRVEAIDELPLLWSGGSGGVLMHEAVGHPAGVGAAIAWPAWLEVRDEPSSGVYETRDDNLGAPPRRDLLRSESPASLRRASFRDLPMFRMSNLVVSQRRAPFDLPRRHVAITLADSGSWDPLRDEVTTRVVLAWLVEGDSRRRLAPFTLRSTRAAIARSLTGARGAPSRYPGVICSDEGQRLPVGTFSADLLMELA
jgi:hypothetical protein